MSESAARSSCLQGSSAGEDSELSVTGDEAALRGTRYIISLDADTRIYPVHFRC